MIIRLHKANDLAQLEIPEYDENRPLHRWHDLSDSGSEYGFDDRMIYRGESRGRENSHSECRV